MREITVKDNFTLKEIIINVPKFNFPYSRIFIIDGYIFIRHNSLNNDYENWDKIFEKLDDKIGLLEGTQGCYYRYKINENNIAKVCTYAFNLVKKHKENNKI